MADLSPASVRMALPVALAVLGAGVWYLWTQEGRTHSVTLESHAYSDISYDIYADWRTMRNGGTCRHYPEVQGPNILNRPLANEDGAISTNQEASPYG